MKILSKRFLVIALLTFVILFLMNFLGSNEPDKLLRAIMIGIAGVIGLAIGMRFIYPNQEDNTHQDFD